MVRTAALTRRPGFNSPQRKIPFFRPSFGEKNFWLLNINAIMLNLDEENNQWLSGLVAWFSLRVREVPGFDSLLSPSFYLGSFLLGNCLEKLFPHLFDHQNSKMRKFGKVIFVKVFCHIFVVTKIPRWWENLEKSFSIFHFQWKKRIPMVGIEPTIFRLGSERLIHWATQGLIVLPSFLFSGVVKFRTRDFSAWPPHNDSLV